MDLETINEDLRKRLRWLTQMLSLSGGLNIIFAVILIYFSFSDSYLVKAGVSSIKKHEKQAQQKQLSNNAYLNAVYQKPFRELLVFLSSEDLLEEGFAKRDLALGCLYTFHQFNVEKALPDEALQRRTYNFIDQSGQAQTVTLFAGLSDGHFQKVISYGCTERWPFKAEGLFDLIKKAERPRDVSLEKAFFVTEEFYTVSALFQYQTDFKLTALELLNLMTDCSWTFLSSFIKEQQKIFGADQERRDLFLIGCTEEGSKKAASLLVANCTDYILKKTSDAQLLKVLSLAEPSKKLTQLNLELIKSPRSNEVWHKAAFYLYSLVKEKMPEPFSREAVLSRFVPGYARHNPPATAASNKVENQIKPELVKPKQTILKKLFKKEKVALPSYVIKKGDSLWKIAHLYKISVSQLMKANKLTKNQVKPGQTLVIPPKAEH